MRKSILDSGRRHGLVRTRHPQDRLKVAAFQSMGEPQAKENGIQFGRSRSSEIRGFLVDWETVLPAPGGRRGPYGLGKGGSTSIQQSNFN